MNYYPKGWHAYHAALVFGLLAADGFVVGLAHAIFGGSTMGLFGLVWALIAILCAMARLNAYGNVSIAEGVLSLRSNRAAIAAIDWSRADLNGPTIVLPRRSRREPLVIRAERYGPELRDDLKVLAEGFRRSLQPVAEPQLVSQS